MRRYTPPRSFALWAGLLALALAATACERAAPPPRAPDILLVVLDTVRADRLSAYGHSRDTSPQLTLIASSGVRFSDVTAPSSWTYPSHAALFTGEPPWVHGAHRVGSDEPGFDVHETRVQAMRADLPTLAERLTAAGYRTAMFSANQWLSPELGLSRGFEVARIFTTDGETLAAAQAEMATDDPRPRYIFVNLMAAHSPFYTSPAPWARPLQQRLASPETAPEWALPFLLASPPGINLYLKGPSGHVGLRDFHQGRLTIPPEGLTLLADLYDAEIALVDYELSKLVAAWTPTRPQGIIAVTSDHGDHLGERGLLDHGHDLYPEVLKVPLVIAAPGRLPAGLTVDTPINMQRLHATLLELSGASPPSPGSLLQLISATQTSRPQGDGHANASARGDGHSSSPDEPVLAKIWPSVGAQPADPGVFQQGWTLCSDGGWALLQGTSGAVELYNLMDDPGMQLNLAAQRADQVQRLSDIAATQRSGVKEPTATDAAAPTPNAETLERLKLLGYTH